MKRAELKKLIREAYREVLRESGKLQKSTEYIKSAIDVFAGTYDTPEEEDTVNKIFTKYKYNDKYDGRNWLENWIKGDKISNDILVKLLADLIKAYPSK